MIKNKNWKNIHQNFNPELQKKWEDSNFTYHQAKAWVDVGLKPTDYQFATYLRDILECKPEDALNFADLETLRNQHQEYLQSQLAPGYDSDSDSEDELDRALTLSLLPLEVFDENLFTPFPFLTGFSIQKPRNLEEYLSEKRLDLKKYFVFNLGKEVKITPKITISDEEENVFGVVESLRQTKPLLTKHLTKLFSDGWEKSAISFAGKNTKRGSWKWMSDELDKKINNGEEVYIVFDKTQIRNNLSYLKGHCSLGGLRWDEIIVLAMEAKPQVQVFQSKKNVLKFLRKNDGDESNSLRNIVSRRVGNKIPGTIEEVIRFETWWSNNLATVISDNESNQKNFWFLVVYEPKKKFAGETTIKKNLKVFPDSPKYQGNYGIYVRKREKHSNLSEAQNEAGWLRWMLNGENPILVIHSHANEYKNFSWIISSPYVIKYKVGWQKGDTFYWPGNLDNHIKPLSVLKIKKKNKKWGVSYYHVGVYVGNNEVFHIYDWSKYEKYMKSRIDDIKTFVGHTEDTNRIGKHIEVYHPLVPFRNWKKIIRNIVWAKNVKYWEGKYCIGNRNCEHLSNMMIYGINYSQQIQDSDLGKFLDGATDFSKGFLAPFTLGLSLTIDTPHRNNDKGSKICLRNEIEEVNDKLGESWKTEELEERIEVPPKQEDCRIM